MDDHMDTTLLHRLCIRRQWSETKLRLWGEGVGVLLGVQTDGGPAPAVRCEMRLQVYLLIHKFYFTKNYNNNITEDINKDHIRSTRNPEATTHLLIHKF